MSLLTGMSDKTDKGDKMRDRDITGEDLIRAIFGDSDITDESDKSDKADKEDEDR